jgi:hypothetical protein
MTNKMQLFGLFVCTQSTVLVSGDVFAHHQEHMTVFTASDNVHRCCCRLISISSMTPPGSDIGGHYQRL